MIPSDFQSKFAKSIIESSTSPGQPGMVIVNPDGSNISGGGGGGGSTQYSIRVDEASSSITYVGEAAVGTAESANEWRIKRLETIGSVTEITYADGNTSFDNVWDDRTSLSYS